MLHPLQSRFFSWSENFTDFSHSSFFSTTTRKVVALHVEPQESILIDVFHPQWLQVSSRLDRNDQKSNSHLLSVSSSSKHSDYCLRFKNFSEEENPKIPHIRSHFRSQRIRKGHLYTLGEFPLTFLRMHGQKRSAKRLDSNCHYRPHLRMQVTLHV